MGLILNSYCDLCHSTEWQSAECQSAESHSAEWQSAEVHSAERYSDECYSTEFHGTTISVRFAPSANSFFSWLTSLVPFLKT